MFRCPYRPKQGLDSPDPNGYLERWLFHYDNCTCPIVDCYYYEMVSQDNHIKDYWISRGKLTVSWDHRFGMLLGFPETLKDLMEIHYPY